MRNEFYPAKPRRLSRCSTEVFGVLRTLNILAIFWIEPMLTTIRLANMKEPEDCSDVTSLRREYKQFGYECKYETPE